MKRKILSIALATMFLLSAFPALVAMADSGPVWSAVATGAPNSRDISQDVVTRTVGGREVLTYRFAVDFPAAENRMFIGMGPRGAAITQQDLYTAATPMLLTFSRANGSTIKVINHMRGGNHGISGHDGPFTFNLLAPIMNTTDGINIGSYGWNGWTPNTAHRFIVEFLLDVELQLYGVILYDINGNWLGQSGFTFFNWQYTGGPVESLGQLGLLTQTSGVQLGILPVERQPLPCGCECLDCLIAGSCNGTLCDNDCECDCCTEGPKDALAAQIAAARAEDTDDYTAISWLALVKAYLSAVAVYDDADATEAEIAAATDALEDAIAALVAKPTPRSLVDSFADVTSTDPWWYGAATFAFNEGLMSGAPIQGTSNFNFNPTGQTTRAEFAAILWNLNGSPVSALTASPFGDVTSANWFYNAALWVYENDIMVGSGGNFNPTGRITRQEMAVTFINYANRYLGLGLEGDVAELGRFPDRAQIATWAENQVAIAVENGIMSGQGTAPDIRFVPLGNAMRVEVAAVFGNFVERVVYDVVG